MYPPCDLKYDSLQWSGPSLHRVPEGIQFPDFHGTMTDYDSLTPRPLPVMYSQQADSCALLVRINEGCPAGPEGRLNSPVAFHVLTAFDDFMRRSQGLLGS